MNKLDKTVKLGRNWEFVVIKGSPYLINVANSTTLLLQSVRKPTEKLFQLIDKEINLSELSEKIVKLYPKLDDKWVRDYISLLESYNALEKPEIIPSGLSKNYLIGLERQIDYLRELKNGKTNYENQLKLRDTKIVFLGLGNIAHYIIISLVASGIGKFILVDFDSVERRNIARQPIFRRDSIGGYKSEIIANYINGLDIGTEASSVIQKLTGVKDVIKVIQEADLVIQSCDIPRFIVRRWITEACLSANKPLLTVYSGRIGPFCIPHKTPCYGCFETYVAKNYFFYYPLADHIAKSRLVEYPELAVVSSVTSALASKEIIAHLIGIKPETYDHFIDVNPYTLMVSSYKLKMQKKCYACQQEKK